MHAVAQEIDSQPRLWRRVAGVAATLGSLVPNGARVAFVGCGTSYYVGKACAGLFESGGFGPADAFPASEVPPAHSYDVVVAISRSGTTSEVIRALRDLPSGTRRVAITAAPGSPVVDAADDAMVLDFADEESIVQTRFATTTVMLWRAHVGHDVDAIARDGEAALQTELPLDPSRFRRFVFLGNGWVVGLCDEAALKLRETAGAWCEAYPALEFRHGPIAANDDATLVWALNPGERELIDEIERTGSAVRVANLDPLAELVLVQRTAVRLAEKIGLDPDRPRWLSRSVVLDDVQN
jgi:fructoselysine-6-P-deglycase FrlB-like protein